MADKYGAFSIYVATDNPAKTIDGLLKPSPGDTMEGPDSSGIYWSKTCTQGAGCFWSAEKKFGNNVLLSWVADKKGETDDKFARLNSVLTDLGK